MKKWIIRIGLLALVLVLLLLVGGYFYADSITRTGIERGTTFATGVNSTLEGASLKPFQGELALNELVISNPDGFKSAHFLQLGDAEVQVSLGSLMSEKVVVPKLHLNKIDVNLERSDGNANYQVILDNLQKLSGEPDPDAPPAEGKKYVINEVLITDVTVKAAMLPSAGEPRVLTIKVPDIKLTDVGSDSDNGVLMAELTGTITRAVLQAVVEQAGDILPAAIAGGLKSGLTSLGDLGGATLETVGGGVSKVLSDVTGSEAVGKVLSGVSDTAGKVIDDVGEKVGEAAGKTVEAVGDAAGETVNKVGETAGKATEDLKKGIGGLFGGKKDEPKTEEQPAE